MQSISRGRLGRRTGRPVVPRLPSPWQDTVSAERIGWRQLAANLNRGSVFEVDYQVCLRCGLGWVEQPYTMPQYQRCGLASAGLAALRARYSRLEGHTRGGHIDGSSAFWNAAGAGVPGGCQQRGVCPHVTPGG